jgi:hypothetical protein
MNHVVPSIIAAWPPGYGKDITINQDNAPPHPLVNDPELLEYFAEWAKPENGGWQIRLICQPANSPDLNILDLAFFRALQSVQQANPTNTKDALIAVVRQSFENFPLEKCKKVWTTLQMVMDQVLIANGNNNYKLPHMSKAKTIRRTGRDIPLRLPCTGPLPLIHPPFATPAVSTAVAGVQAAPATVSPASSPRNNTHLDGPAGGNDSDDDDSLMGNGVDGHENDDEMEIDWEDPHEEIESAWI